jgi:hypothetical protein
MPINVDPWLDNMVILEHLELIQIPAERPLNPPGLLAFALEHGVRQDLDLVRNAA